MILETAIRTRLLSLEAVAALVGVRAYVLSLPESVVLPAVRIQLISEVESLHMRGTWGWQRARVQVDAVSTDIENADGLTEADQLDAAMYGGFDAGLPTGLVGFTGTIGDVRIGSMRPGGRFQDYAGENLRQVRVSRDWFVDYQAVGV